MEGYYRTLLWESYINTIASVFCLDLLPLLHLSTPVFHFFITDVDHNCFLWYVSFLGSTLKKKKKLFYKQRIDAQPSLYAAECGDTAFQLRVPRVGIYVLAICLPSHREQVHLER